MGATTTFNMHAPRGGCSLIHSAHTPPAPMNDVNPFWEKSTWKERKRKKKKKEEYRVRQRGCSLTHSARTPPAVHQGITNWVDEIEIEKKILCWVRYIFIRGHRNVIII